MFAATVIISTAVLFYKIVKDDETEVPAIQLARSLVIQGSVRCFSFFLPQSQGMSLKMSLSPLCYSATVSEVFATSVSFFYLQKKKKCGKLIGNGAK